MAEHDRAEEALARAFARHEGDIEPLDPALLVARARRRPRWLVAVAAAAVLVVAVPLGAVLLQQNRPTDMSAGAPVRQEQPEAAPAPPSPEPASPDQGGSAEEATRTVTVGGVAVDVPSGWGVGVPVGSDWCADPQPSGPREPFVQREWPVPRRAIACPGPVPDDRETMHLAWRPAEATDVDEVESVGAWRHVSRVVGPTRLTVVVAAGDEPVAARILATARVA
ncbi:MAG: hypothetical protein ACLGHZ_00235 [Actinomycetes bacterium]